MYGKDWHFCGTLLIITYVCYRLIKVAKLNTDASDMYVLPQQQQALVLQQQHFQTCSRPRFSTVVSAAREQLYRSHSSAPLRRPGSDSSKQRATPTTAALSKQQQQQQQPQQKKKHEGTNKPSNVKHLKSQPYASRAAAVAVHLDDLSCAHFGPCSGCTLEHGLWVLPIVSEAQRFFASRGFEGFSVQQGQQPLLSSLVGVYLGASPVDTFIGSSSTGPLHKQRLSLVVGAAMCIHLPFPPTHTHCCGQ
jgi:hypothetical protein